MSKRIREAYEDFQEKLNEEFCDRLAAIESKTNELSGYVTKVEFSNVMNAVTKEILAGVPALVQPVATQIGAVQVKVDEVQRALRDHLHPPVPCPAEIGPCLVDSGFHEAAAQLMVADLRLMRLEEPLLARSISKVVHNYMKKYGGPPSISTLAFHCNVSMCLDNEVAKLCMVARQAVLTYVCPIEEDIDSLLRNPVRAEKYFFSSMCCSEQGRAPVSVARSSETLDPLSGA